VRVDIVPVREGLRDGGMVSRSATRKLSSVASENTTPKPKVSSAPLRSTTDDLVRRVGLLHEIAK